MTSSRSRRSSWWFAAAALVLAVMRPGIAFGDDKTPELPEGSHLHKIGPQAVVIVDEHGNARMYDDPAEEARACKSPLQCWGGALGAFLFFGAATYEEFTSANDASSRAVERVGPSD